MRAPFFMDHLSSDNQRKARRIFFGILFGYTAIVLLVFAIVIAGRQLSASSANAKPCSSGAASQVRRGDCGHDIKVNANVLSWGNLALS
jgi:nitrogen fixation/metabolism regulation signal transduction histidine kinase